MEGDVIIEISQKEIWMERKYIWQNLNSDWIKGNLKM